MLGRVVAVVAVVSGWGVAPARATNTMNMSDTYLCTVVRQPSEREKRTIETIIIPWMLGYLGRTSFTPDDMQAAKGELIAFCARQREGSIVQAAESMRRAK